MGRARWMLLLSLWALGSSTVLAQPSAPTCPVQYASATIMSGINAQPLLLGGVWNGCESGCQPRTDVWSRMCKADPEELSVINVCESSQRQAILEVADTISNGEIRSFSPCQLHSFLGNRTLWVIGDSHTKNMYNAMRCLMLDFFDHSKGECAASHIGQLQQLLEKAALTGHAYNTPPRCLHLIGGGRICLVHSPLGTALLKDDILNPGTLQVLHTFLAASHDIFYISFGRWHSNNCDGIDTSYTRALEQVGAYLQAQRSTFPNVFFAPPLHDHTICTAGAFNDSLPYCVPPSQGGYSLDIGTNLQRYAREIMTDKYGIPLIEPYWASLFLNTAHVMPRQTISGKADCLHYCRPGMPEIEIWHMAKAFEAHNISHGVYLEVLPEYRCNTLQPQFFKPYGATNPTPPVVAAQPVPGAAEVSAQNATTQHDPASSTGGSTAVAAQPVPEAAEVSAQNATLQHNPASSTGGSTGESTGGSTDGSTTGTEGVSGSTTDSATGSTMQSTSGTAVGSTTGTAPGSTTGSTDGSTNGTTIESTKVGGADGSATSSTTGITVGSTTGIAVGSTTGITVGITNGITVGSTTGIRVGSTNGSTPSVPETTTPTANIFANHEPKQPPSMEQQLPTTPQVPLLILPQVQAPDISVPAQPMTNNNNNSDVSSSNLGSAVEGQPSASAPQPEAYGATSTQPPDTSSSLELSPGGTYENSSDSSDLGTAAVQQQPLVPELGSAAVSSKPPERLASKATPGTDGNAGTYDNSSSSSYLGSDVVQQQPSAPLPDSSSAQVESALTSALSTEKQMNEDADSIGRLFPTLKPQNSQQQQQQQQQVRTKDKRSSLSQQQQQQQQLQQQRKQEQTVVEQGEKDETSMEPQELVLDSQYVPAAAAPAAAAAAPGAAAAVLLDLDVQPSEAATHSHQQQTPVAQDSSQQPSSSLAVHNGVLTVQGVQHTQLLSSQTAAAAAAAQPQLYQPLGQASPPPAAGAAAVPIRQGPTMEPSSQPAAAAAPAAAPAAAAATVQPSLQPPPAGMSVPPVHSRHSWHIPGASDVLPQHSQPAVQLPYTAAVQPLTVQTVLHLPAVQSVTAVQMRNVQLTPEPLGSSTAAAHEFVEQAVHLPVDQMPLVSWEQQQSAVSNDWSVLEEPFSSSSSSSSTGGGGSSSSSGNDGSADWSAEVLLSPAATGAAQPSNEWSVLEELATTSSSSSSSSSDGDSSWSTSVQAAADLPAAAGNAQQQQQQQQQQQRRHSHTLRRQQRQQQQQLVDVDSEAAVHMTDGNLLHKALDSHALEVTPLDDTPAAAAAAAVSEASAASWPVDTTAQTAQDSATQEAAALPADEPPVWEMARPTPLPAVQDEAVTAPVPSYDAGQAADAAAAVVVPPVLEAVQPAPLSAVQFVLPTATAAGAAATLAEPHGAFLSDDDTQTAIQSVDAVAPEPAEAAAAAPAAAAPAAAATAAAAANAPTTLDVSAAQVTTELQQRWSDMTHAGVVTPWNPEPQQDWALGLVAGADMGNVMSQMQSYTGGQGLYRLDDTAVQAVQSFGEPVQAVQTAGEPVQAVQQVDKPVQAVQLFDEPVRAVQQVDEPVQAVQTAVEIVQAVQPAVEPVQAAQPVAEPVQAVQPAHEAVRAVQPAAGAAQSAAAAQQQQPAVATAAASTPTNKTPPAQKQHNSNKISSSSSTAPGAVVTAALADYPVGMNNPVLLAWESDSIDSFGGQAVTTPSQESHADHQTAMPLPVGVKHSMPVAAAEVAAAAAAAPKGGMDAALPRKVALGKDSPASTVPKGVQYSGYITLFNMGSDKAAKEKQETKRDSNKVSPTETAAAGGASPPASRSDTAAAAAAVTEVTGSGQEVGTKQEGMVLNSNAFLNKRSTSPLPSSHQQQQQQQQLQQQRSTPAPGKSNSQQGSTKTVAQSSSSSVKREQAKPLLFQQDVQGSGSKEGDKQAPATAPAAAAAAATAASPVGAAKGDLDVLVDGHLMIENPWGKPTITPSSSSSSSSKKATTSSGSSSGSSSSSSSLASSRGSAWSKFGSLLSSVTGALPLLGLRS